MDDKIHELGPKVEAHRAWMVFKDYDGNAPDADVVICASEELAKQAATFLNEYHDRHESNEEYEYNGSEYGLPFVDGWEHCARYRVQTTVAEPCDIKRSMAEVLADLED